MISQVCGRRIAHSVPNAMDYMDTKFIKLQASYVNSSAQFMHGFSGRNLRTGCVDSEECSV
jgi:hypothetical protein